MKKITAYIFLSLFAVVAFAQDGVSGATEQMLTKSLADSFYMINDYKEAIYIYEQLLQKEGESADVYYNLGNSYYKSDEVAKAILNYERALLLSPADKDVEFNLAIAKSKTVDKVNEPYELFFISWIVAVVNLMGISAWSVMAVVFFLVLLSALLFFLFSKNVAVKKITFFVSLAALIVTIFANMAALHHHTYLTKREAAIIMIPSVTAKSTPDVSGTDLFVIHEGRKVQIVDDTMKGWKEIELEDGTKGWVPTGALEKI